MPRFSIAFDRANASLGPMAPPPPAWPLDLAGLLGEQERSKALSLTKP